jgi:hypothetical protein
VAVVGGGIVGRRAYATASLRKQLVDDALPVLTTKAHSEFQTIPAKAREEIRRWVHGKALNVAPFVDEICSNSYREKLHSCGSDEERDGLLLASFCGKVATDSEIMNRVETIAEEVGQELDLRWGQSCGAIGSKWQMHIQVYPNQWDHAHFTGRVEQLLKARLSEAIATARVGTDYPALGETFGKIGKSAMMLIPMMKIRVNLSRGQFEANPGALLFGIPTFMFYALRDFFQYVTGLFSDPRPDLQRAISARLSLLGNRVGSEFESEVRGRLGTLHEWQERSLTEAARLYAESCVGWI